MTSHSPSGPEPATRSSAAESEITRTDCPQCGAEVLGVNGRYACTLCSWCNHWSEGHGDLPTAQDDPDYPSPGRNRGKGAQRRHERR
ncbi:hypothetical protein ABT160_32770 [Streptomyces sp. NPDC001941]|uniref:hypothetical protein n=1 Tax=Streptomyces sp. NPDC001941 TaxID=3154659 RepID=UPI003330B0B9